MRDDELRDLLSEAVDDVEPRYALDEIRARTTTPRRRWPYAAGGAVLAVAAVVTAFAVVINGDTDPRATDPASSTSPSPSPVESSTATLPPVAVYFVGSTPDGPRLYREFRPIDPEEEVTALETGVIGVLTSHPQDVDYYNIWPGTGTVLRSAEVVGGVIRIDLDPAATQGRGLPEVNRRWAIEQLIFTAQAAVQERLPVQFLVNGNPSAEILGLPASEPLANGPVLDTLALVSLTTPAEGMVVDNDEPLVVEGAGNSFEGNIVTRFEDASGAEVLEPQPVIAGWMEERLFPFRLTLDLSEVPPGEYVVTSQTDDPSGEQRWHSDTRNVTVVD